MGSSLWRKATYADAIANEIHRRDGGLLGPPGHVGCDEGQNRDEGRGRGLREVVPDELAYVLVVVEAGDEEHSEDRQEHARSRDQEAVAEPIADDPNDNQGDDLPSCLDMLATRAENYCDMTGRPTSTAPPGVPRSKDCSFEKPNDTMSWLKKFDKPPFGISATKL